ncbi:MAG TPA: Gfo/Idh/MocA family oxidoreductase [Candidatus Limnocylindria bacterium]|nr:Gfo/Idh/MocA family oxidoreductase [Candidatus Limnocylindria bacterium]
MTVAPLRMGIAGLGTASALSFPALARHPGIRIVAAADTRPSALDAFRAEYGGRTFDSVEALCGDDGIDVVYVCTPNFLHAEHAVMAAEHRKHVLVEKPIAVTLEECDRMIAAATRNRVQLLCGHTQAHEPAVKAMRKLVESGDVGRLLMMNAWCFTDLLLRPRAAWELDTARGGGVVFIQAPHQVDVIRLIGGGIVRGVRAAAGLGDPSRPTEGHYAAFLDLDGGVPATIVYSGYAHFDSAEYHGWTDGQGFARDPDTHRRTRAAARAHPDEPAEREAKRYGGGRKIAERLAAARRQPIFGTTVVSCERGDVRQTPDGLRIDGDDGPRDVIVATSPTGRDAMLDELCAAVRGERPAIHDGPWAKATLEVCLAIIRSGRERREIVLEHQVPVVTTRR